MSVEAVYVGESGIPVPSLWVGVRPAPLEFSGGRRAHRNKINGDERERERERERAHQLLPRPVEDSVVLVASPLKQVLKQLPQVIVVWSLKEVESPYIAQVSTHLVCEGGRHHCMEQLLANGAII